MNRSPGSVLVNIPGTTLFVRNPDMADLSKYTMVRLGRLDHLNGPAEYPFPTREAAEKFAADVRRRHPERTAEVV